MIYLDHAATTPMYPEVREVLRHRLDRDMGNPSSIHVRGRETKALIDEARYTLSREFRAPLDGVIFTSGATEAAHLAIVGGYLGRKYTNKILLSPLVHKCVWSAVSFLEKHFGVTCDLLPITKEGFIDFKSLESIRWEDYAMVICEHGNSELGHVQPVARLGKIIDKYFEPNNQIPNPKNQTNPKDQNPKLNQPLFIVDGAASVVSETVSLEHQKCDLLFFSGEKIGGPSGVGALIKNSEVRLEPLVAGSHEFGNRGGTENVLGIVGLHEALKVRAEKRESLRETWKGWHEQVLEDLLKAGMNVTTPEKDFLPHVIHFIHPEMKADLFVQKADLAGFGLSAGSACSSGTITGSTALKALGYDEAESKRGVRISWGWSTTEEELKELMEWI